METNFEYSLCRDSFLFQTVTSGCGFLLLYTLQTKTNQQILLLRKKKKARPVASVFAVLLTTVGIYRRELSSICRVMD